MKISDAIQMFTDYVTVERRLAAGTVSYYVRGVEDFARYLALQEIFDIEDIDARDVRGWQMELLEGGQAASTVVKQLAALRAWFRYLRKNKYLCRDVMAKVTPPKAPKRLPVFFREKEAEKIYGDIYPDTFDGEVEKLVLRMLYETGMRRAEMASLTLGSVDLEGLGIKVFGKRSKERIIPIERELARSIARYVALRDTQLSALAAEQRAEAGDRLLVTGNGKPVNEARIYKIVEKYMSVLSNANRTSPHVFRHTFATHILNEGGNIDAVKELLGHSNLAATEVYTHVTREHLKETYKHAHPRAYKK